MWWYAIVGFVAAQRLGELALATGNTRVLKAEGAIEHGRGHYPLFVVLHTAWIGALLFAVPPDPPFHPWWLAVFVALSLLRLWVIATLGRYWTTRVIVLPDVPLVRRGPYRLFRHPNYIVVAGELFAVPMIAGAWEIAVLFTVPNLALLAWRWYVEDTANAARRKYLRDDAAG